MDQTVYPARPLNPVLRPGEIPVTRETLLDRPTIPNTYSSPYAHCCSGPVVAALAGPSEVGGRADYLSGKKGILAFGGVVGVFRSLSHNHCPAGPVIGSMQPTIGSQGTPRQCSRLTWPNLPSASRACYWRWASASLYATLRLTLHPGLPPLHLSSFVVLGPSCLNSIVYHFWTETGG